MTGQRRISQISLVLALVISAWLVSGCATHNLRGDQSRQTGGDESALNQYETHESAQVRRINVGLSRGVMKEFRVGKMPDGHLVTVTWTDNIQLVRLLCAHNEAGGCQRSEPVPSGQDDPGYRRQYLVLYAKEGMSDLTLKILAH